MGVGACTWVGGGRQAVGRAGMPLRRAQQAHNARHLLYPYCRHQGALQAAAIDHLTALLAFRLTPRPR